MFRKMIGCAHLALAMLALAGLEPAEAAVKQRANHGIEHAQLVGALKLKGRLFHVQGVATDGEHIWVTSVDKPKRRGYLHEFDRSTGKLLRRIELTDGARYHPGGISISGSSIWVPVAEMKQSSSAVLVEVDADTMTVRRSIPVADHIGCIAASPAMLIAGNWDSRLFYVFDLAGSAPLRTVTNPSLTRFQDMKLIGSELVAGGVIDAQHGAIDWIDWPSLKITRTLGVGVTKRSSSHPIMLPYTAEGMTIEGQDLYLVPQDGPSQVFHFRLDA